jgi:HSP20 family protein
MVITRFDPFRELVSFQGRLNRLFEEGGARGGATTGSWVPPVDVFETDEHDLVLRVELPGLSREAIDVTIEHDVLTIKGTKARTGDVKDDQYRRVEGSYGAFSRTFSLPDTVDASRVSAEYKDGILTVKLPFRAESKPRTISVQIAA